MILQEAADKIINEYKSWESENKVIVIGGPTASGKTSLAISVARSLNGEIVSADSMQIYRKMDIGTAKPTQEEKCLAIHHMTDIIEPWQEYSVADYCSDATKCIKDILIRGKTPVVAGGTGLYISSLTEGISFAEPTENELTIHNFLTEQAEKSGIESVYDELKDCDPDAANQIHINNKKRVIRALELYKATGLTLAERNKNSKNNPPEFDYMVYILNPDREQLYRRINTRCDLMIQDGLLREIRKVYGYCKHSFEMGLSPSPLPGKTSSQAIGYKEFDGYFNNSVSLDECIETLKQNSRRYAKRQLTWFRHMENADFLSIDYPG